MLNSGLMDAVADTALSPPKGLYCVQSFAVWGEQCTCHLTENHRAASAGIPGVIAFFYNDILVSGSTQAEHDELGEVLKRFRESGLRLSREKCLLSQR